MLVRKRYLWILLLLTVSLLPIVFVQAQQAESIDSVTIIGSVCDEGQSSVYITFTIDQESDRWLLFEVAGAAPIAFDITEKSDVTVNFVTPAGTTPDNMITLTVSIGTEAYDTSIDQASVDFYCESDGTETPTDTPTEEPTETPTDTPTEEPTEEPTETPTELPPAPDCTMSYASPSTLWPPNHQMVGVSIKGVEGATSIAIANIKVNEPDNATGDGNTIDDVGGIGTEMAMVRAERSGNGVGRTYEISFIAENELGETCAAIVFASVPHDQGQGQQANNNNNEQQAPAALVVTPEPNTNTGGANVVITADPTPEPPAANVEDEPAADNGANNADGDDEQEYGGHDNGNGKSKGKALGKFKKNND